MLSRKQILSPFAMLPPAWLLSIRAEFLRLTGIHYGRLIPHLPGG
jgi:hypothetical protein